MGNCFGDSLEAAYRPPLMNNHYKVIREIIQTLNECEKQAPNLGTNLPRIGPDSRTPMVSVRRKTTTEREQGRRDKTRTLPRKRGLILDAERTQRKPRVSQTNERITRHAPKVFQWCI